eukprot:TRINITY_DN109342_c0_g1_i1.p1 TRINITY_DN109342_c0_g1~~TRINITY_DN109342_c0_g1_i1.p1  ORF type:complete len:368 (+),score=51.42 TRINITY_DN109342_c0_g1_i1:68-1105(+)
MGMRVAARGVLMRSSGFSLKLLQLSAPRDLPQRLQFARSSGSSKSRLLNATLASAFAGVAGATLAGNSTREATQCESGSAQDYYTVTLRDGRCLSYNIHGTGVPVFAFHGMESSRETWDTMVWGKRPLTELYPGMQIIALDRPGYGDSTTPPRGYGYKEFVDDLVELADKLHLQRFCVAGHSSGGPYALAAAALLPDRVVACAAVSADAPYAHSKADPELTRSGNEMQCDALIRSGYFGGVASNAHPWKQGPMGFVCDYVLERIEWPFAVEDIGLGSRLTIWVGSDDVDCIIKSGKFLRDMIPESKLREQPRRHGFKKNLNNELEFKFLGEVFQELETQWKKSAQ